MSDDITRIPYREGEPAPGPGYTIVQMVDTEGNDGLWWVPSSIPANGPIRREDMEPLLPMLRWVWRHLSQYIVWCRTFQDWELGFTHPGSEAAIWTCHTYAFLEYIHKHPNVEKAAVFGAVMSLMNGREVNVEPASVARQLKGLLANPPSILRSVENFTKDGRLKTNERHLR
jgi:hypothetical protein